MDYKDSGVNIDAGNEAVERIKPLVKKTFSKNVLTGLGLFAGCYELPSGYTNPVLVSCTDGVGTKLALAIEANQLDTVGIDLVAMSVNDLICCGATPLYFLDYIACNHLDPSQMESILSGISEGCIQSNCSLIGGEMAEMGDMYKPNDFDLAGFATGIVEKDAMIDGSKIQAGQTLYGLPSSGIHSNGYSLVRKVLTPEKRDSLGVSLETLLTPTRLYVKETLSLIENHNITGIAHITGGGLQENCERLLPEGLSVSIDFQSIPTHKIFHQIQEAGTIDIEEMRRVFNMGIGMVYISDEPLSTTNTELVRLGKVISK